MRNGFPKWELHSGIYLKPVHCIVSSTVSRNLDLGWVSANNSASLSLDHLYKLYDLCSCDAFLFMRQSLCNSSGCLGTCFVEQAGFKFRIHLPVPLLEHWD